jgi:catecholate siderophore receptor
VPGITIGAGEGGNPVGDNLFIRGYNAQTDTYIDGIRDAGSQSREIFNLEQVEVVKGPNSAYGGRSSAGGGVNLVSKTAQPYDFNNASSASAPTATSASPATSTATSAATAPSA